MRSGTCERCGGGFVDRSPGQRKRFCSDNCRKRLCEDVHRASCIDCGETLSQGSSWASKGYERCVPCRKTFEHERFMRQAREVEQWWADGMTLAEIGRRLGWASAQVNGGCSVGAFIAKARSHGLSLPYRYPAVTKRHQEAA